MSDPTKSVPTLASELWQLIVAYFKQEAIEPLKQLGRFVAIGVGGALLLALGLVMLTLAGLRALQTETSTTFTGNWSWAPYLITLAGCAAAAALAARAITANRRKAR
ncbi:MAG TPA: phage holin family protein [Acidimicrobiales bacterium]|nr:phage holin family protein [Acidimicrobiales bacterium]